MLYACTLVFQFGIHEELHHKKYNVHDIELCLNDAHCCHHESIETHCVHHAHINVAIHDCDFCDQIFNHVLYSAPLSDWSLFAQYNGQIFGQLETQQVASLLIISRNKSPPIFIS